ncbi:hypothetical protein AA309_23790 [Microvirga vignae]|uniref:Uncharacterized protein n=2 Tax=Microvirga vignae TaxID=1225564 RepID=A0A0H1R7D1_9HYPH|nr:hypothetical protein AA309_23790 [Microvirga vignae]
MAVIAPKLSKLIPMLATDHDGEVVAAVRAIGRTLNGAGMDFHNLVEALCQHNPVTYAPPPSEKEPETWSEIAIWCRNRDGGDLSYKERKFVVDMIHRTATGYEPTEKQAAWLRAIRVKLQWGYVP